MANSIFSEVISKSEFPLQVSEFQETQPPMAPEKPRPLFLGRLSEERCCAHQCPRSGHGGPNCPDGAGPYRDRAGMRATGGSVREAGGGTGSNRKMQEGVGDACTPVSWAPAWPWLPESTVSAKAGLSGHKTRSKDKLVGTCGRPAGARALPVMPSPGHSTALARCTEPAA